MAAAFWAGRRLFSVKATRWPPSFWLNAFVTMLILLGPAIEDAAVGKDVVERLRHPGLPCSSRWRCMHGRRCGSLERWHARRSDAQPV